MEIENIFEEIEGSLSSSREVLLKKNLDEEDGYLHNLEEAHLILNALKSIAIETQKMIQEFPTLEYLFEKNYCKFNYFCSRDNLINTALLDEYLFPDSEMYPLIADSIISNELIENYVLSFKDWVEEVKQKHRDSQELIFEKFDLDIKQSELGCICHKCSGDFRARIRDFVYEEQTSLIDEAVTQLEEIILSEKLTYISDYISKLKKHIDKNTNRVKYKLKRGSLNKLEADIKNYFKIKLGSQSELGETYKKRLVSFLLGSLSENGHQSDLVSENEFERFFSQMGIGIWRAPNIIERDFEKLVKAVQAFKRKDISATILRDYLGQFWVHSEARRKERKIIYHMGPTNSGKTYNAIEALKDAKKGCYLAPLRLLASELFDTLNDKGCKTNLLTGEEVIEIENATHYSSTIEMAKLNEEFDCVVIDEIQMITDPQRGWAWTRALVNINADVVHLCGDHSVFELVKQILDLTGDILEVNNYERKTKLSVMPNKLKLSDLDKHDTLIVFSRRNALKYKRDLENLNFKVSIVYGRLSPEVRREQARKFDEGETDIMVATDAIAMGMNLPIKRVIFSAISKFWDGKEYPLTNSELKQIAGRAGRYKRFPEGFVSTLQKVEDGLETIEAALSHDLEQKELAMVGPDLEIFRSVNLALTESNLQTLSLSEFLRLFNTMSFEKPFYCVDLKEMIELAEMVEDADTLNALSDAEIFGFACAPVNQGLVEHVQYYVWILNHYVGNKMILNEEVDPHSQDIDYLETAIKCVELYQWLARHFDNKNFSFDVKRLQENKTAAIEKLNQLLSEKTTRKCSSCGAIISDDSDFNICESCFGARRAQRRPRRGSGPSSSSGDNKSRFAKKSSDSDTSKPKRRSGGRPSSHKETENKDGKSRFAKPNTVKSSDRGFSKTKKSPKKNKADAFKKG